MTSEDTPRCPDFDLAPKNAYPPAVFVTDQQHPHYRFHSLILSLSLAFNDLKDLHWFKQQLEKGEPENIYEAEEYAGQYAGMGMHFLRMVSGVIFEIVNAIQKFLPEIDSADFKALFHQLPPESKKAWENIVDFARESMNATDPIQKKSNQESEIFLALRNMRNKSSFHYGQPAELMKGYESHFKGAGPRHELAYASLGKNSEGTRYYYADAAANGHLKAIKDSSGIDVIDIISRFGKNLNSALRFLIQEFLEDRKKQLAAARPPSN